MFKLCREVVGKEKATFILDTMCCAHCLDLMLEDIEKLPHIKKTIERVISISGYIYNRTDLLNMKRQFTKQRELLRPAKTRFVTTFITLSLINEQRNNWTVLRIRGYS